MCQCQKSENTKEVCVAEKVTENSCGACSPEYCTPSSFSCYSYPYSAFFSSSACFDNDDFTIKNEEYKVVQNGLLDCNQTECCCLVGTVIISRDTNSITFNNATLQGFNCPSSSLSQTFTSNVSGLSFIHLDSFINNGGVLVTGSAAGLTLQYPYTSHCFSNLQSTSKPIL